MLLVANMLVVAGPAMAACYSSPDERTLFVQAASSSSLVISNASGITTTNRVRDSVIDPSCSNAERHSTAHVRMPDYSGWVEIGWWKKANGKIFWFLEANNGRGQTLGGCCQTDITYLAGTDPQWRISHHTDGTWRFYIKTEAATEWAEMFSISDSWAGFSQGIPMGETGVRGETTSAADRHYGLDYRPCSSGACWDPWPTNILRRDSIPGWHYDFDAGDAYYVRAD